jgi:hypothetical protein
MRILLLLMTVVVFNTSHAAGVGVRAGTTGLGADFGWGIVPTLGGRVGISGMNFNADFETSDIDYDAKAKIANLNGFLDWSPVGPFRITAGLVANNNKVDLTGQPRNASLPPGSSVTGTVKPEHSLTPYLGIGYGNVWTKGVNFYFDLGIMFQGTPKVDLNVNCTPSAQCTAAQNQVAAEERRVQDELNKFKYYPVFNIGITIGF